MVIAMVLYFTEELITIGSLEILKTKIIFVEVIQKMKTYTP